MSWSRETNWHVLNTLYYVQYIMRVNLFQSLSGVLKKTDAPTESTDVCEKLENLAKLLSRPTDILSVCI